MLGETFDQVTSNISNDVVIITGVGAIVGVLGRWVYTSIRKHVEREIHQTNGGSSIRDFINRTTDYQDATKQWQQALSTDISELTRRMDEHDGYHRGLGGSPPSRRAG